MKNTTFLKLKGNYRKLRVYKVSEVIYDITYFFAHKFLDRRDRTIDQMIQAARSGKQNIVEGNEAGYTSIETQIKLTNVAKASLEELKIDYEDYLRVRNKVKWGKGHPRYLKTRQYAQSEQLYLQYPSILPKCSDEEMANLSLTLIHQSSYMLQHLIEKQQEKYLKEGGVREQMKQARLQARC